jgi:hypothetical protein
MSKRNISTTHRKVLTFKPKFNNPTDHVSRLLAMPEGASFRLEVCSDQLAGIHIRKGDMLRMRRADSLRSGELAAVVTPYGLMIRRYRLDPHGFVRLESDDPHNPILCLAVSDVEIVGRVVSLKRDLRGAARMATLTTLPERIAAIVGKTYAEIGDAATLSDDEAMMMIRDLMFEAEQRPEGGAR